MTSPIRDQHPGGTGELAVGTSEVQMPDRDAKWVVIKASPGNSDNVFVGFTTGVTAGDAATDQTTGLVLDAGQETPWLPCNGNLDNIYLIAGAVSQSVTYLFLV